jgi:tetratricopeptide (TPR) repeat protein
VGSRLTLVSVVGAVFASATALAQPGPLPAADFAKQGTEKYRAGDFAGAVASLEKAVELEPNNFDYRYMLAQSYRQSNRCDKALPLYKALVDVAPPAQKAEVQTNMALCPDPGVTTAPAQPEPTPPPPPPPAEPTVVYKDGGSISGANMGMLMGSGFLVGAGAILLLAGYNDSNDADNAAKYSDHDAIDSRASTEYVLGAVGVGAGIALGVVAVIKIRGAKESDTTVSFKPRSGGGSFVLERSW